MEKKKMSMRYLPLFLLLGLLAFLAKGLYLDHRGKSDVTVGHTVSSTALETLKGKAFQLPGDLPKPLALLHIWATWCGTCRAEMVDWTDMLKQVPSNTVEKIGVLYKDEANTAQIWLTRYGNPYDRTLLDNEGVLSMELGVYGTPETYLLDQSGRILAKQVGPMRQGMWEKTWLPMINKYTKGS